MHRKWLFTVDELYNCIQNVEVNPRKIKRMIKPGALAKLPPVILIGDAGKIWMIDGHHRIHAYKRAGKLQTTGFVIEEKDSAPYVIWYNGKRTMADAKNTNV
jgi:hypothetical protein